jgi:hypothetical protein
MGDPLKIIRDNWAVIAQAPWAFVALAIVLGVLIWVGLTYLKDHQIGNLESRIRLKEDEIADYKRKLEGATPDRWTG